MTQQHNRPVPPELAPAEARGRRDRAGRAAAERLRAAIREAAARAVPTQLADQVCAAAAAATNNQGVSLCAWFTPDMCVPIGVSGQRAALAEQVQFSSGHGPCWMAVAEGRAVHVADLAVRAAGGIRHGAAATVVRDVSGSGLYCAGLCCAGAGATGGIAPGAVGPPGAGAGCIDGAQGRWPECAGQLGRVTGYRAVLSIPMRLASGLLVVLTLFSDEVHPVSHQLDAATVVAGLVEVLDAASPAPHLGGAAWLDSAASLQRAAVWVAESLLINARAGLSHREALALLREHAASRQVQVDEAAADLVSGRLTVAQVLTGY